MNKKGQLSPQELEDMPTIMVGFIFSIALFAIFLLVISSNLEDSRGDYEYSLGRQVVSSMPMLLSSERSRPYGKNVMDSLLIDDLDPKTLENLTFGYHFLLNIESEGAIWTFGKDMGDSAIIFHKDALLLDDSMLRNAKIDLMLWEK